MLRCSRFPHLKCHASLLLVGLLLWPASFGCNRGTDSPAPSDSSPGSSESSGSAPRADQDGHEQMRSILAQIAERTSHDHPYMGQHRLSQLRQRASQLNPATPVFDRVVALSELGREELYLGQLDDAIEHLTEAYELFPQINHPDTEMKNVFHNRIGYVLGTAFMRLGETQNCCLQYSSDSCIVPIQGGGIHTRQHGSKQAIKYFREVLERPTENKVERVKIQQASAWLLNLAYMTIGGYPQDVPAQHLIPPKFFQSEIEFPKFTNIYPQLKLDTFNLSGTAIVDDFNGDHYLDIFTTTYDPTGQTQFFLNNGDGTFSERTREWKLDGFYGGLNAVQADYDNDGDVDVFIVRGAWLEDWGRHPNSLLRNDGNRFTDVTFEAGLGEVHYPCKTAAWGDYDNDGDLDLYVGNETTETCPSPAQLFRNNGDGTFTDVARAAGVQENLFAMGAVWGDYDDDRYPDLFVSNGGENRLYHNNRDGTFTDVAEQAGVAKPLASFPAWFWDYNNDGALDLYVGCSSGSIGILALDALGEDISSQTSSIRQLQDEVQIEMMALYQGDGQGGFADVADESGLTYPSLPMGANFGDLNNDGFLDFYLGTGDIDYSELMPNVMFLNERGETFHNVTMAGGFGHLQKGHGVAFADFDHDGDQDVYMQMGGAVPGDRFNDALYENPGFGNHALSLKLVGNQSNRSAIGARIRAVVQDPAGRERTIHRRVGSGGSFGCNPLRQSIGLGQADRVTRLEIYWPTSDTTQVFHDVPAGQLLRIDEGGDEYQAIDVKPFTF